MREIGDTDVTCEYDAFLNKNKLESRVNLTDLCYKMSERFFAESLLPNFEDEFDFNWIRIRKGLNKRSDHD